ncbi:hypothetical protein GCM10007422_13980 [Pedobacter zeae]|uniref:Uncharacterized protein n=1 Tax=Pedobacter zeae TaxID=1737356 RepID=A0ABQ1XQV4_9SPHI|nr:hypothetical protein GCM10007422_13980 [Pedobacter zeae]
MHGIYLEESQIIFFQIFHIGVQIITNDNVSYRYGQQDRINIPLFMLWPKTHGSQSGVKLNDKQTSDIIKAHNSINNYYKNNMK